MDLSFRRAEESDAAALAALGLATAQDLTNRFGRGHWSSASTEKGVLRRIRTSHVLVATTSQELVAALALATKKPWAIDRSYFTPVSKCLYLLNMAVTPACQGKGIGRRSLREAEHIARSWPADAVRLDAYDAPAGAGGFYGSCGYREVGRKAYRGTPLIYYELLLSATPGRSLAPAEPSP